MTRIDKSVLVYLGRVSRLIYIHTPDSKRGDNQMFSCSIVIQIIVSGAR